MRCLLISLVLSLSSAFAQSAPLATELKLGKEFCFSEVWIDGEYSEIFRCPSDMLEQDTAERFTLSVPRELTLLELVKTTETTAGAREKTRNTIGLYAPFTQADFVEHGLEYSHFGDTPRFGDLGLPGGHERFALLDLSDVDLCKSEIFPNGFIRALDVWVRNWLHKSHKDNKVVEVQFQLRIQCIARIPSHAFLIPKLCIGSIGGSVHTIEKLSVFESFFGGENAKPSPIISFSLDAETLDASLLPEGANIRVSGTYNTIQMDQENTEVLSISIARSTMGAAVLAGNCNNADLYIYDATGKPHGFLPPPRKGRNADIVFRNFRRPSNGQTGNVYVIDHPFSGDQAVKITCNHKK